MPKLVKIVSNYDLFRREVEIGWVVPLYTGRGSLSTATLMTVRPPIESGFRRRFIVPYSREGIESICDIDNCKSMVGKKSIAYYLNHNLIGIEFNGNYIGNSDLNFNLTEIISIEKLYSKSDLGLDIEGVTVSLATASQINSGPKTIYFPDLVAYDLVIRLGANNLRGLSGKQVRAYHLGDSLVGLDRPFPFSKN